MARPDGVYYTIGGCLGLPTATSDPCMGTSTKYRTMHGLVFGHFNETSSQVGKILYAMAVHAVQTWAPHMGGVVKVQKIAAVNSWLQPSLSRCVAKARARLFLPSGAPQACDPGQRPSPAPWDIGGLGGEHQTACGLGSRTSLPSSSILIVVIIRDANIE